MKMGIAAFETHDNWQETGGEQRRGVEEQINSDDNTERTGMM